MVNSILAKKIKMTQTFEGNTRTPITVVNAGPCVVTFIKKEDKHGYNSIQMGFETRKLKNTSKPLQGHLKETTKTEEKNSPRYLKEVKVEEDETLKVGDEIKLTDIFAPGDVVAVTGISKGKGFAGGIKRYGFRGGSKTHGQSDRHRAPGSIGQGTTPGRVYKGKRMAGHMGQEQVTVRNLKVVSINPESNELWIKGPVPGANGSVLFIKRTSEKQVQEVQAEETQTQE